MTPRGSADGSDDSPSGHCFFDIAHTPFSLRGSWLNLSPVVGLHTTADDIHVVSHLHGMHPVLALVPELEGSRASTERLATPSSLTWRAEDGSTIVAVFDGPRAIRLRGRGLAMRVAEPTGTLTPFSGGYLFCDPVDGAHVLTSYESGRRYRIRMLSGTLRSEGSEALGMAERHVVLGAVGDEWEAEIVETTSGPVPDTSRRPFDRVLSDVAAEFQDFAETIAPWERPVSPTVLLAAYVVWSATVSPDGMLGREAVLMSMHWMDKVWSWDHCFNALALAAGQPELALDQFFLPFDHQDDTGSLPDSVAHSEVLFNFVKPPIHGWVFRRLRRGLPRELTAAELRMAYDRLSRWTDYWLGRRAPGAPLPYYQHGNDSGWDNATTFDRDRVVVSPDLAAFLVVQVEVVAGLARELGLPADRWVSAREQLLQALLHELWTPGGFVAIGAHSGEASSMTSLQMLLPLVLGEDLPTDVRAVLSATAQTYLTDFGLATELPTSDAYQSDGYWRGPIWAPPTALVEAGLRESGYPDLADEVSQRFRDLCARSGFAENFDALTGVGLRDRAYTWTASVYLILAGAHAARVEGSAGDLPHDLEGGGV
jgi:glycogen debranching enzyme